MQIFEYARRVVRKTVPRSLYCIFANLADRFSTINKLGFRKYSILYSLGSGGETRSVKIFKDAPGIHFRPSTPDVETIVQNLVRREWGQIKQKNVVSILDAGAYIGDTAVFFLHDYPSAVVVAMEPNPESFELLERNLVDYGDRSKRFAGGVWSEDAQLVLGGNYTGVSVSTLNNCEHNSSDHQSKEVIECLSIQSILEKFGLKSFDIVKLDIEGAEMEVLTQNNSWLSRTKLLLVEFHGDEIESTCKSLLKNLGFLYFQHRSVHYFHRDNV